MSALAPNHHRNCRLSRKNSRLSPTASPSSRRKQLDSSWEAPSWSPLPSFMPISGVPPRPTSREKEESRAIMGPQTPTPARARLPASSICPMNIRSTMLYSTLISWASMVGMARRSSSPGMGADPKLFFRFKTVNSCGKIRALGYYTQPWGKVKRR